jgi:enoyl-CoA hydratase
MSTLQLERDPQGILVIQLHRPDKLNALNHSVFRELQAVFTECLESPDIKGMIITGSGKAFCAGADIQELQQTQSESGLAFATFGQRVFRQLETLGKPVIAAVNGYAFGGGCELAMSAHLRLATDTAQFGQPEVKLGVIPGFGGTQRLARLVGKGRALDLCLTGRSIDAPTALQWGLISEICTNDNLLARSKTIMNTVLSMGPIAIRHLLHTIDAGYNLSLPEALDLEATRFALCCATQDKTEGTAAFLEKRKAEFRNE